MSTSWSVSIIVSMQKDVRISFWIHAIHMTKIYQPPCLYPSTVFTYWQSIWNMRITFPVFSCNTIFCAGQTGISNTLNSVFVNIHCVSIKTSTFGFFYISRGKCQIRTKISLTVGCSRVNSNCSYLKSIKLVNKYSLVSMM